MSTKLIPIQGPKKKGPGDEKSLQETLVVSRLNDGLVTTIDPVDIEPFQLSSGKNFIVRDDKVYRRPGSTSLVAKPDSNKIIGITVYREFSGTTHITRFTKSSIYWLSTGVWTAITGGTLNGSDTDYFRTCSVNGRFFYTNNGIDKIQEINFATNTAALLGNAPKYKFVVGFHNRIVAAYYNEASPDPTRLGWSGTLNFAEWDPLVDNSAGFQSLIDNGTDYANDITGLFVFGDQLTILRQNSIWLANKLGTSVNPFQFYQAVPATGCDCPDTAAEFPGGIVWYNYRLNQVLTYTIGDLKPEIISEQIKNFIAFLVQDPLYIKGSYSKIHNVYTLLINATNSSIARVFNYDFKTKGWSYGEYDKVNLIKDIDYPIAQGSIDSLVGTIDQLLGTIDQLTVSGDLNTRLFGLTDGNLLYEDSMATTDNGTSFTCEMQSKIFQVPPINQYILSLQLEYTSILSGSFSMQYSKDNVNFTTYKTVTFTSDGLRHVILCKKLIRTTNYIWRIVSTSGSFNILSYAIYVNPAGEQRNS